MKKVKPVKRQRESDELKPEYHFDYTKAKPNRFAAALNRDRIMVVLDPDVSKIFRTTESVNNALRAIVSALPKRAARAA